MPRLLHLAFLLGLVALSACQAPTDLPPRKASFDADPPQLLPLSALLDQRADGPNAARLTADPDTRAQALRARAARLRAPVIAPADRQRMLGSETRLR